MVLISYVLCVLIRFSIIHLPKVIMMFLFLYAVRKPSLLGGLSLLYVVFMLPFRKSQNSSRIYLLFWAEVDFRYTVVSVL